MVPQQYCLRWKHHHSNVQNMFAQLLEKEKFCDVTLYCSPNFATQVQNKDTVEPQNIRGVSLRAHRVVLAACSELLGTLLGAHESQGEPVLVIDGAEPNHLRALLDYMYTGEMNVHHSQLASLLKTAEELRIKGLTDIRWNNKDEPPDCATGAVATTTVPKQTDMQKPEAKLPKQTKPTPQAKHSPLAKQTPSAKQTSSAKLSPPHSLTINDLQISEPRSLMKKESEDRESPRINVNGGPPPLIKLPTKEKVLTPKRENSDSEHSPSPKRQRLVSGTENTDDELSGALKLERDDWRHGNMQDITVERVVGWGADGAESSREISDDEWADAPADIGSFLHTRLQVDGDNSEDEESNESGGVLSVPSSASTPASASASASAQSAIGTAVSIPIVPVEPVAKIDLSQISKPTIGPKSGPTDPRFTDVVKLGEYLQHGRRPQFWEENYVKRVLVTQMMSSTPNGRFSDVVKYNDYVRHCRRKDYWKKEFVRQVMEAVRLKELEMKQAAEILGVSYGTLYGRYRDVYGCINRPYRAVRDFWQVKGPSEVLERLQRGEVSLDAAASALGVSVANLAAHVADFGPMSEFDPIPIEMDVSLRTYSTGSSGKQVTQPRKATPDAKIPKKVVVGSTNDEESIPVSIISTQDMKSGSTSPSGGPATRSSGKWPSIRVANIESLRGGDTAACPSQLMRTRPDLTIAPARKPDETRDET